MTGEPAHDDETTYMVRFNRTRSTDPLCVIHEATLQAQAENVAREYATGAGDRSLRWRYDVDPSEGDVTLLVTSTDREVIVHFASVMSERYGQCVETHASKTRASGMPTGEPERSFPS